MPILVAALAPDRLVDVTDDARRLVDRARGGDQRAFERLVHELQGPVRTYCRRMLRDEGFGDDAAQEVFVRVWRALDTYIGTASPRTWVLAIAHNVCIDALRRERRTPVPMADLPDVAHVDDGERRALLAAIDALDDPYRSALLMWHLGMTYEEIADAQECPIGTVRSRLHEAKRRLATVLREQDNQ